MKIKDLKNMINEMISGDSILLRKPESLNEANYERVKDKIENQMVPFIMISAFRSGFSRKENLDRQKKLEKLVSAAKYPWTKMPGSGYIEEPEIELPPEEADIEPKLEINEEEAIEDTSLETETPEGIEVRENSIIIWDQTRPDMGVRTKKDKKIKQLGMFLADKYEQDTFVYGKKVADDEGNVEMSIRLYDRNGEPLKKSWAGPWSTLTHINDDDLFWSKIGGHRAKLVELQSKYQQLPVKTKLDAMKKQHYLNAVKSALNEFEDE
jgi:hypothetical protein